MNISPKHTKFIELVANGINQDKAYADAIAKGKISGNAARSKGSTLAKRYAKEIQEHKQLVRDAINNATSTAITEMAEKNILSTAERMEMLSKIANGEIKIKKPFVIAGKIMEYPSEPDHNDRTKAIAELNKMDGSYAVTKQEVSQTGTIRIVRE
jgi:ribosomal protein S20